MADGAEGQSKSAKRRAAKKANAAAAAVAGIPGAEPVPAQQPKAKAKAAAQQQPAKESEAAAKPAAKAQADAKTGGKAKAKAAPAAAPVKEEPVPVVAEPAAQPKKVKKKKKNVEEVAEAVPRKVTEELPLGTFLDDGTGGEWATTQTAADKKKTAAEKKKEKEAKAAEDKKAEDATKGNTVEKSKPRLATMSRAEQDAAIAEAVAAARAKAEEICNRPYNPEKAASPDMHTSIVTVPNEKVGVVIGPGGATCEMIKTKTGVSTIDTAGDGIVTISGLKEEGVHEAAHAIKEIAEKGYTSLAFENFDEQSVLVHPSSIPDLIGSKGAVVRKLKEELKVEINMPQVPAPQAGNNNSSAKKYPVQIAGSAEKVELAKEVVREICLHYCHALTHPGQTFAELEIPEHNWRFIIGRAGSEMKHIQNSYRVKVYIPRDHSECKNVVVVGDAGDVKNAKAYIDKTIAGAENAQKGREAADKKEEYKNDGGDDEQEAWMKPYLRKPKF